jgi:uncharacterized protein GlcG (DUF336 family)
MSRIFRQSSLSVRSAARIAQRCVEKCEQLGFAVAATVVDRSGVVLAQVRANGAGPATLDGSRRKAYTSVNMGMSSLDVLRLIDGDRTLRALREIDGFLPLQGGVPVVVDDELIGAVGVGGASGEIDERCAIEARDEVMNG